jgi:predicted ATPase/DNA-binding SARP family transcriptional activator
VRIGVLGPLEVRTDTGELVEVAGARLRTLVVRLALDPGRVLTTRQLVDALWGDDPPAGAGNALQALVSRLRKAVPDLPVESKAAGYRLAIDPDAVDAHRFERLLKQQPSNVDEALALWRGPALADVADADFARAPTARLTELRLSAIEDFEQAPIADLEALILEHPTRERLAARLMVALDRAGRPADALAAFERTRAALADQLGADPSPELASLHLAVLRGQTDKPSRVRRTNLRSSLTSFVGRDADVARVAAMVSESRLVTLVGPGGAGKTRLAVESAHRLADAYPDGAWLVELAPVADPGELAATVLSVLGLREQTLLVGSRLVAAHSTVDASSRVVQALRDKQLLIVLDNCEHLVYAAASLADEVLGHCPGVHILATSREPLAIGGETLWTVDSLEPAAAVHLFADRAAAARPGFEADGDATEICRALDGMPLAIELAAARLRTMTASQLAQRLDDRFRVLVGGSRTALPRHKTLRAVVDWSWDLLADDERAVWQRLSLFAAGAAPDAAVDVCGLGPSTVDIAYGLVEKSLLTVSGDARPRFGMLETIRAYGRERLAESGEQQRVRGAYVRYFVDFAERAEPHLRTRDQLDWLARLRPEHDNLHQALRTAIADGDTVSALRLVAALGSYWWLGGHRAEGADLAAEVIALATDVDDHLLAEAWAVSTLNVIDGNRSPEEIARWVDEAARLAGRVERDTQALRVIGPLRDLMTSLQSGKAAVESLSTLDDDPDLWVRAIGRLLRAHSRLNLGRNLPDAEADLRAALADFAALGERWGRASCLAALAEETSRDGHHELAAAMWAEALTYLEELGSLEDVPQFLVKLAHEQWMAGDVDEAHATLDRTQSRASEVGLGEGTAAALVERADLLRLAGDLEAARTAIDAGLAMLDTMNPAPQLRAVALTTAGLLAAARGDLAAARVSHEQAMTHAKASTDGPIIARTVVGFAALAFDEHRYADAAALLGAAAGVRGAADYRMADLAALERTTRERLGGAAYDKSYLDGRTTAEAGRLAELLRSAA